MNTQLRRLHLIFLLTKLTPDMFYSVEATEYGISLTGELRIWIDSGYLKNQTVTFNNSGFGNFNKNTITITLT